MAEAIKRLQEQGAFPSELALDYHIERTRDKAHGDFACNIAMMLAKQLKQHPRKLAEMIVAAIPVTDEVETVTIAGPGFINFVMADIAFHAAIKEVLEQQDAYGNMDLGQGRKIHIEYVSANPTGPLHVGHGRGAAFGASLANLLAKVGYQVHREYYVNDAGRQMRILMVSVWLRYLQVAGVTLPFPANAYQGKYVQDIAEQLKADFGDKFLDDGEQVFAGLPPDEADGGDKEQYIDALALKANSLLGEAQCQLIQQFSLDKILTEIRDDLSECGVSYQAWFSEQSLLASDAVTRVIEQLRQADVTYERAGALWFNATRFGDEKDRVLIRANKQHTYFASDLAYHMDKFARGYDRVIDVFGADHHGYITRLQAAMTALGVDAKHITMLLVQFATLYRGKERVQMSTRSGSFVTLRQLHEEVGKDAARFFYVMRKAEQHMDFDLELAKSQSNDNPVYYIQYAHARICSVMRQLADKGLVWDKESGLQHLPQLQEASEKALMSQLSRFPEVIYAAAMACEPHQIAHYLRDLANAFHVYYNAHAFIVAEQGLRDARLCLIKAAQQILAGGLTILGVSTPEQM